MPGCAAAGCGNACGFSRLCIIIFLTVGDGGHHAGGPIELVEEQEAAAEEAGVLSPLVVRLVLLHDAVVVLGEVGEVLGRVLVALVVAIEDGGEAVVVERGEHGRTR